MKKEKTKKMTIDDLAKIIKESVVDKMATKEDINGLEKRVSSVENKLERIEKRFDNFAENKVDYLKFNVLVKKVETLEKA